MTNKKFFDKVEAVTGLDNRLLLKNVNNIELSPFTAASMRTHFHNLLHMASAKPAVKNMMMVNISQLVEILLEEIASVVVSGNIDLPLPRLSRQRQLVQKAKDYICIRPSIPPRIDDMCAEIGTSERSLRDAFKSCTGISAGAYLKAFRLNQVRTILKTGSPKTIQVQDVAFNWGFSHMGQFAADYKNLFGEPPSKTLSSGKDKQYAVS